MRRISLAPALALAVALCAFPAGAFAGKTAAGDGTLEVTGTTSAIGANGSLTLSGKGVVYGYLGAGTIIVYNYKPNSRNAVPTISGAKMWPLPQDASYVLYSGSNIRFLFPGGKYKIEIDGADIDLSAVGYGSVNALGNGQLMADSLPYTLGKASTTTSWGALGPTTTNTTPAGGKNG